MLISLVTMLAPGWVPSTLGMAAPLATVRGARGIRVARTVTRGGTVTTFEVSEGGQHDDNGHRAGAVVDAL